METVAINLITDKHNLRIISAYEYNPPNKRIQNSDLPMLFCNTPTILLGDLNSKNIIWGCKKTNPNGLKLYEYTPCTPKEIQIIINKLANKKSPGHDIIKNKILKNLTSKSLSYIASLMNSSMRLGYFPDTWKIAIIIPIYKPEKQNSSPKSHRPISLLPTFSKLLERILLHRIKPFLKIIPLHQFGFKPFHSTTHQLQWIFEIIVNGYKNKKFTTTAFLDISQAFDKVWHHGLILKIKSLNRPLYLNNTLLSFIANRKFHVRIGADISQIHNVKAGVPGDFNSHSLEWGYDENDANGNKLQEWMALRNMKLIYNAKDSKSKESSQRVLSGQQGG
ncbi:Endonuclease/exonuclease/phosphatase,Reverse transcriptase domain [Cinara cedri]|uniref:Endonuclease/exonuclease/phosphatase,Reverse transcriptase domain n=1 Tax=Cinara cedri TaxID=506608 RepID=A0A5E4M6B1_9HEMI|nr:Endonuclease/exonuclease/phosphatase,Reverse transcriptase domain [Cinara cedri]